MATHTTLDGSPLAIQIAIEGYSLEAPGLRGTISEMSPGESASRSDAGTLEPRLQEALRNADIYSLKVFEIEVETVASTDDGVARSSGAVVTADGEPAMVLRSPFLGTETMQAVLYTDEAGTTRWIFPSRTGGAPDATRGGGQSVEFLLPLASAQLPPRPGAQPGTRGPITKLGRRLVHVLAWATGDIIGKGAVAAAQLWENSRRPYLLRRFPFDDPAPLSWDQLSSGRALLLIHGTFSTGPSTFGKLTYETISALQTIYGHRIFAFDHPTLHHSPTENVKQLFALMPPHLNLEVDIVTHSRGGLVGRELTERAPRYASEGKKIRVRRAIFVASPHRGTILTDAKHGIKMLDRYTNLFTDLPDDAFTITVEALFMLAKLIYFGTAGGLPGLLSMFPPGEYLRDLNNRPDHETIYYSIGADFRPVGSSLLARFGWGIANAAVDGIFGEVNDAVVPTRGSYELLTNVSGFPIIPQRRMVLDRESRIHHCNYFGSKNVTDQITKWLQGS
ncbi:MAG: alpha/beta hydrolase [Verrucomicrobia bacterium]|nr:alpha/beta hydrolase [Verrucomicrobiota bacterium]